MSYRTMRRIAASRGWRDRRGRRIRNRRKYLSGMMRRKNRFRRRRRW